MRTDVSQLEDEDVDGFLTATAEANLICYVEQAWQHIESSAYMPNWHIDRICEELQAFTLGEIGVTDMIINVPPGTGKSLLVNVFWPTWVWGPLNKPGSRWFFASYSSELTTRDSLRRRYLMQSPWYQSRWGTQFVLKGDQDRKTRYANDKGGEMMASSVGGGGLGEHPDFIIADDPIKTDEANSILERQSCIDWWDHTISTRGHLRGSRRVVIMQRLHESDLSGHLLAKGSAHHVCIPMRFERDHPHIYRHDPRRKAGELMWPSAINEAAADKLALNMGSHMAAGQLQQRPAPAGGGLFKREWFAYYRDGGGHYELLDKSGKAVKRVLKSDCWRFISCDLALTTKTYNDYSVYQVWDVEKGQGGQMFLVEQWRDRQEAPYVEDELRAAMTRFKPLFIGVEDNSNFDTSVIQRFRRDGLPVRAVKPDRDKVTRATTAAIWMENGKVAFPQESRWLSELERELLLFPNGEHDDAVDCVAYAAIHANSRDQWEKPKPEKLPPNSFGARMGMDKILNPERSKPKAFSLDRAR